MTDHNFSHQVEYRLRLAEGADDRAPGGAVTVELCGHWDHEGPCRWPHHSTITAEGEHHLLLVRFNAPAEELESVNALIEASLQKGQLTGPDGRISVWKVCTPQ
jgi:hypothetical protein